MPSEKPDSIGSLSTLDQTKAHSSLSSPLDLQSRILRPQIQFDFVPFLDLCVIALLFALLHSELVFAPGLTIDLPESQARQLEGLPVSAVLTLRRDMVLFDGGRYTLANLHGGFRRFLRDRSHLPGIRKGEPVLLVKMDRQVGMQPFITVCEIARSAGFARIQIAALTEPGTAGEDSFFGDEGPVPGSLQP